jgi:hypothetical protein
VVSYFSRYRFNDFYRERWSRGPFQIDRIPYLCIHLTLRKKYLIIWHRSLPLCRIFMSHPQLVFLVQYMRDTSSVYTWYYVEISMWTHNGVNGWSNRYPKDIYTYRLMMRKQSWWDQIKLSGTYDKLFYPYKLLLIKPSFMWWTNKTCLESNC